MAVRPIDANVAIKKIQEYMEDFPKAFTWFATCRMILSMLRDENQTPTLRPVTREQVEKAWKGGWEPGNPICPICGKNKFDGLDADIWADWMPNFCPHCGAPMTDESVEMMIKKLEEMQSPSPLVTVECHDEEDDEDSFCVDETCRPFECAAWLKKALKNSQTENEKIKAERDTTIRQLRGYCNACKNYTPNHNEGPCEGCKHEYFQYRNADTRDNWEWRGVKEGKSDELD